MFFTSSQGPTPLPGSTPRFGRTASRLFSLHVAILALGACAPTTPQRDYASEGQSLFASTSKTAPDTDAAWSIVLAAYRGDDRDRRATLDLATVHADAGLRDAYVEDRGDASVIAYGRYDSPDERRALADLERLRTLEVDGATPFAGAMLSPPSTANLGSTPEYDLRNVKERLGDWVIYTLQVGVYGVLGRRPTAQELAEFREAAEEAVLQLRREGEQAFYYHGPTKSMVLIGAWGDRDFEPSTNPMLPPRYEAPAIRRARREFPYNLLNGQAIRDNRTGKLQPSQLVGVPEG